MTPDYQKLKTVLTALAPLPMAELAKVDGLFRPHLLKKAAYFVEAGRLPDQIGFVTRGLLRSYYLDEAGIEFIKSFFVEGEFVSAYEALLLGQPSGIYIQALEDTALLIVDFEAYKTLLESHPAWQVVGRKLAETSLLKKEARERQFLISNAEGRYLEFLQKYPHLEKRLKQHQVAAYLGITPVSLSRIRARLHQI